MASFHDRSDAGRQLAQRLFGYAHRADVLVFGLPRGGVPVAFEVAQALDAPLEVFVVRKLGVPGHEELAMGAIAAGGVRVLNEEVIEGLGIADHVVEDVVKEQEQELRRRLQQYRGERPPPEVRGRTVILIDDGLATGSTMRAAVAAMRQQQPARLVVAVPVAAASTCQELRQEKGLDEVVCLLTPEPFMAVGLWYEDFSQTSDQEVRDLLELADQRQVKT